MKKLAQIIAEIQKSGVENSEALAKDLTDFVGGLNADHESKIGGLTSQIDTLTTAMGIDQGSTQDKLSAANTAIASLNAERDSLKSECANLQGAIAKNSRDSLIRTAAETEKVNATVLEAIIGTDEVKVEDGKVTVNNQPLKEWVEQHKAPFVPALYSSTPPGSKLPGTPPHSQPTDNTGSDEKKPASAIDNYFEQNYKVPEFLTSPK
jgi:ABC-type transporter Mla subunit MlaD